ncbi:MAG: hypothetical protein ACOX3R_02265 [Desulfitobacteriia bacterium]
MRAREVVAMVLSTTTFKATARPTPTLLPKALPLALVLTLINVGGLEGEVAGYL